MELFNKVCFFLMLAFLLVYGIELRQGRRPEPAVWKIQSKFTEKSEKMLFVFLLVFLALIRCVGLGSVPGGINQDGAMGAVDALALANYGTDRFGTWLPAHFKAWGYGQMSVLLSYMTVPFIWMFGLNAVTMRLPMVIVSVAGAAAVYKIMKEFLGTKAALLVLLVTAVNPWHFMQSRWALDCNVFPHMFIIGTCFLVMGLNKDRYYYISMIFYALCMYSYGVSFYMVPVFLLCTCIMLLLGKRIGIRQVLICMLIYFGAAFPIYGTMLINFMKWDTVKLPFVTLQYFEDSVRSGDMLFFSKEPLKQLGRNFGSLIKVVFWQKPDLIWNAIDDFGTMYLCMMPLIAGGLVYVIYYAVKGDKVTPKVISRILLIYWCVSIFTGLCINSVNVNRINIIFYCHIIFAGIAVFQIGARWKAFAMTFVIILCLQSSLFMTRYFTVWAEQMEDVFYKDFLAAVEFAGERECDYYYITPDTQYTGSWNVSEILTLFALEMDAEYYQGKTERFMGAEIAYRERFSYRNPMPEEIRYDNKTAYVIRTENLANYDNNYFAVKDFNEYSVVMPGQYADW